MCRANGHEQPHRIAADVCEVHIQEARLQETALGSSPVTYLTLEFHNASMQATPQLPGLRCMLCPPQDSPQQQYQSVL